MVSDCAPIKQETWILDGAVDLGPVDANPALGYIQVVPGFVILNIILQISVSKMGISMSG